ncbi:hypothetical protein FB567DRAFT_155922 [Paraphoma chrysanthemicola]|uniref:NF-kappa-B inhibitor-like protein 1 n=1 Tax=Paraphoma chrysanthemicola TaxID=798071 RepID=A0A8K0VU70_9PLEO|nr:hypothetical protein FB567DRAFT_155922 [Paraphoma chrysanthemicola]
MEESGSEAMAEAEYSKAKASKFSFKSKSESRSKRAKREDNDERHKERSSKRHHGDDSRRSRKHKRRRSRDDTHPTSTRDGEYYDPDHRHRESLFDGLDETGDSPNIAPEEAFRESLFDALADDEGAAYWEGVYGQPLHVYPDTKPGPDGKLERMTEEEYAEYVRRKMWEKSHEHILQEREAKEKARRERKKQRTQLDDDVEREEKEREDIRRQMEESLKRGADRKKAKEAAAAWENYARRWDDLKSAQNIAEEDASRVRDLIPWPVVSGKARDVSREEIERFLRSSSAWKDDAAALLKVERVRWHPDKMQQRFGQHIDTDAMKLVTAVFQIIDRLWSERR